MTLLSYENVFVVKSSSGSQSITGVGFKPRAVIFWMSGVTTGMTQTGNSQLSVGFAARAADDSKTSGYVGAAAKGIAATPDTNARVEATGCIGMIDNNNVFLNDAQFTSFDNDGFTLNWTITYSAAFVCNYLAIGGTDCTAAYIKWWAGNSTNGDQAITGVGFKPDCAIHASMFVAGPPEQNTTAGFLGTGAMDNRGNQWSNFIYAVSSASPTVTGREQITDACISTTNSAGTINTKGAYKSMDSDGFTITWATGLSTGGEICTLCLNGGAYTVGHWNKTTGANGSSDSVGVGTGYTPVGVFYSHISNTSSSSGTTGARMCYAGSDGSWKSCAALTWKHNVNPCVSYKFAYSDRGLIVTNNDGGTLDAYGTPGSFSSGSFGVTWTSNNAVATEICFVAFCKQSATIAMTCPSASADPAAPTLVNAPAMVIRGASADRLNPTLAYQIPMPIRDATADEAQVTPVNKQAMTQRDATADRLNPSVLIAPNMPQRDVVADYATPVVHSSSTITMTCPTCRTDYAVPVIHSSSTITMVCPTCVADDAAPVPLIKPTMTQRGATADRLNPTPKIAIPMVLRDMVADKADPTIHSSSTITMTLGLCTSDMAKPTPVIYPTMTQRGATADKADPTPMVAVPMTQRDAQADDAAPTPVNKQAMTQRGASADKADPTIHSSSTIAMTSPTASADKCAPTPVINLSMPVRGASADKQALTPVIGIPMPIRNADANVATPVPVHMLTMSVRGATADFNKPGVTLAKAMPVNGCVATYGAPDVSLSIPMAINGAVADVAEMVVGIGMVIVGLDVDAPTLDTDVERGLFDIIMVGIDSTTLDMEVVTGGIIVIPHEFYGPERTCITVLYPEFITFLYTEWIGETIINGLYSPVSELTPQNLYEPLTIIPDSYIEIVFNIDGLYADVERFGVLYDDRSEFVGHVDPELC